MALTKNTKITVLLGGMSDERSVSLESGSLMAKALRDGGYTAVSELDLDHEADKKLREIAPEVVLNALHGTFGEDGRVQGLLDMLKIPYTGSGVTASAVGMDKILSKMVMQALAIPTPSWQVFTFEGKAEIPAQIPFVLKDPVNGSSRGVYVIKEPGDWEKAKSELVQGKRYLIEEYIKGREITVAVLQGKVLDDVEIIPKAAFYDFDAKYLSDKTEYMVHPDYPQPFRTRMHRYAAELHKSLGCRGVTRSDFLVTPERVSMLEINTLPGMTSHSLVPMAAKNCGIGYLELIERLLDEALRA